MMIKEDDEQDDDEDVRLSLINHQAFVLFYLFHLTHPKRIIS